MFARHKYILLFFTISLFSACGDGGGSITNPSNSASPTATPSVSSPSATPSPVVSPDPESSVTISGQISFDFVPNASGGSLDYDAIEVRPVRGATVYALDGADTLLAITSTDETGQYSVLINENTQVRIRVVAELLQSGSPSWDFKVTDNTSGNAVYVMDGSLVSSGTSDSSRDLHASSGWTGSSYGSERAAAPFAILDNIYDAVQLILQADQDVKFAAAELRWSVDNVAISGSRASGFIGTSFYDPSENNMYILGDEDNDTDEYDKSIILHEWAHYFEDNLSRSDSIGGEHFINGAYDMRVAFGEGFANAFASIAGNTPLYSDSAGRAQSRGFQFSIEENNEGNLGWFSENSVSKIVYDIADDNDDGSDSLSLGFTPIYRAMTSDDYVSSPALTSIYLFGDVLKANSDSATDFLIDTMMQSENIFGDGIYGAGETNDSVADLEFILPVYNTMNVGETINVCGNNSQGEYNGIDVRRFVRLDVPAANAHTVTLQKTLGTGDRDPDFIIYGTDGALVDGSNLQVSGSSLVDVESSTFSLQAGEYILEIYDYFNADRESGGGASCFDVTVD